jgi:hypothetical protein
MIPSSQASRELAEQEAQEAVLRRQQADEVSKDCL